MFKKRQRGERGFRQKLNGDLTIIRRDFALELRVRGYSRATIELYLQAVDSCHAWLTNQGMELGELEESVLGQFLKIYAARCRRRHWAAYRIRLCRRALRWWLAFLREQGYAALAPIPRPTAQERLLQEFDHYLSEVRGLAPGTRLNLCCEARRFLQWLEDRRHLMLQQLDGSEVICYVRQCARTFAAPTARNLASGLRCFLRFLAWTKRVDPDLDQAVPTLAPWPRQDLPPRLSSAEYRQLLASFDRKTALGRRDYALALCLGELGLRASEVATLQLEDLDWNRGVLSLPRTKQRRERQLPLPPQVARAIASYLQHGRPQCQCRAVFVRHRPPLDSALSRSQVGIIMSRACKRLGLSARGAHVLRYRLATQLQRRGVGLKSIADLLGHQCLESAARYARVDFKALRQAALPWPEVVR